MDLHTRHNASNYHYSFNDSSEYNFHNLYPVACANNTYYAEHALLNQRPFIISHSSSPSLGHYSSLITG